MDSAFEELKAKAHSLPLQPGVYLFSDKTGKVIYVGKARVLRNRVSQYFHPANTHPKVRAMVTHARSLNYIATASEYEALVLECSLIKQHQPCYNILLKDASGRCFIRVDMREPYPKFEIANRIQQDRAQYFGPYFSRELAYSVVDSLRETLRLPVCSRVFPRDIGRERPCLHYQMKQCYGPCRTEEPESAYRERMEQAVMILGGKTAQLEEDLRAQMEDAAEALEFEKAAALRDRLAALAILGRKQKVVTDHHGRVDACALYIGELKAAATVLSVNNGAITGQQITVIDRAAEDPAELYRTFLEQYYGQCGDVPARIFLTAEFEDAELLTRWLSEKRGGAVHLEVPQRGVNRQLLDMAEKNARLEVERTTKREDRISRALTELASLLGSETVHRRIEAYDISNSGDTAIVGSMVVFLNGRPHKSDYRRFAIKGTATQDDYYSMSEVITRRFAKETGETLPDLVLIDGGSTHTAVAKRAMESQGFHVPMMGLVKDDHHRTRALTDETGREISLTATPVCFAFLSTVQDEAHRFALDFNRVRSKKRALTSTLDQIHGVGPVRRKALLDAFRTITAIREADLAALAEVVPSDTAAAVYEYFHPTKQSN